MRIIYSFHAIKRMKQRGITELEVECVFFNPDSIRKFADGKKAAFGKINDRDVKIIFTQIANFIKVVTVM